MSRNRKFALIGCGSVLGIFVLVIVLAVVVGIAADRETAPERKAARTFPPTTAPILATASCPSKEELAYFQNMTIFAEDMGTYMRQIGALSDRAARRPDLVITGNWRTDVEVTLDSMTLTADVMAGSEGPASTANIREEVRRMAQNVSDFATLYRAGLDSLDPHTIELAVERLDQANAHIDQAGHLAATFCP